MTAVLVFAVRIDLRASVSLQGDKRPLRSPMAFHPGAKLQGFFSANGHLAGWNAICFSAVMDLGWKALIAGSLLIVACGGVDGDGDEVDVESEDQAFSIPGDTAVVDPSIRPPAAATPSSLRYYVIPHADDEVESWSLLERDTDHYPVLMLLTHGEQSQYCAGKGFEPNVGERLPSPQPFSKAAKDGRWSKECSAQRVDSWNFFLDEMAKQGRSHLGNVRFSGHFTGDVLAGDVTPTRCDSLTTGESCYVSRGFDVWVGPRSARVVFDLGDGDVTKDEVVWAVRTVQRHRSLFPITREDDIVAAGYANKNPFFGLPYAHGDHVAIHEAIHNVDLGTPGPQWGRTAFGDFEASVSLEVSGYAYNAMFAVGPHDERVGAHTVAYGWLSSPYYRGCERGLACPFSRRQKFWKRF